MAKPALCESHFLEGKLAMRINKKIVAVVAGIAMVGLAGGTAFAYWSSTGTGTGSATTGTSTSWAVASDPAIGDPLSPGGPTQTVHFSVTNPGSGHQNLAAVTASVTPGWTVSAPGHPDCTAGDFTVTAPAFTPADVAPAGVVLGTTTITMKNLPTDQDACKNVTVPLFFSAS